MKWFYVTGCDTGFGNVVAKMLDAAGHGVFAGVYMEKSIARFEKEGSANLIPVRLDVTSDESVNAAAAFIKTKCGAAGLHGVVNNAGVLLQPGPVEWTPMKNYRTMFEINLVGMVNVTKSVLPLIRRSQGRIVNVASIAGTNAMPWHAAYNASKFAVEGFSDALRREMYEWGVTVHIVEPGVFHTTGLYDTYQQALDGLWDNLDPAIKKDYGEDYMTYIRRNLGTTINVWGNEDVSLVPKAMVHALTNKTPKFRYRVGDDSKFWIPYVNSRHEQIQDFWQMALKCNVEEDGSLNFKDVDNIKPAAAPKGGVDKAIERYHKGEWTWYAGLFVSWAIAYGLGSRARL